MKNKNFFIGEGKGLTQVGTHAIFTNHNSQ